MSTTVLEALMNAEINLSGDHPFQKTLGLNQLHNAIAFLEKGYGSYEKIDVLLEMYEGRLDDIPECSVDN